jgi:hypothetical protein
MRLASDIVVAAARGAAIGVIVGYFVHTADNSGAMFGDLNLVQFEAAWALLGGAIGLGVLYLSRRR